MLGAKDEVTQNRGPDNRGRSRPHSVLVVGGIIRSAGPDAARRRSDGLFGRVVVGVAGLFARALFRTVEVTGPTPRRRSILVCSHLNGLVDPVLLVVAVRRLPRFLAKATLWRVRPARPFLRLVRLIPVERGVDRGDMDRNASAFAAAIAALGDDHTVAIFPEGTTHDQPWVVELRTGAARIALEGHQAGLCDVDLVPVGIAYEDKVELRGRALVCIGSPIAVDGLIAELAVEEPDERALVRAMTDRIGERLRAVSPNFRSFEEFYAFDAAAEVVLRGRLREPRQHVAMADQAALARSLSAAGDEPRRRVVDAIARYHLALHAVRLADADLVPAVGSSTIARRLLVLVVTLLVFAPLAVAGAMINTIPTLIVVVAGLAPRAPVTKGTVRVLAGLVVFPLAWLAVAWLDVGGSVLASVMQTVSFPLSPLLDHAVDGRGGFWWSVVVFLVCPLLGAIALFALGTAQSLWHAWRSWRAVLDRRGQLVELRRVRATVVIAVADATGLPLERVTV
jgi:glycerol-3-phosphate O-acyltransferase/dihydroxyacetone phosphate acyltransferase